MARQPMAHRPLARQKERGAESGELGLADKLRQLSARRQLSAAQAAVGPARSLLAPAPSDAHSVRGSPGGNCRRTATVM